MISPQATLRLALISLLYIGTASSESLAQDLEILLIGNSYTAPLSTRLKPVLEKSGQKVNVTASSPGGFTLSGHLSHDETLKQIRKGKWDYVVMQEQSLMPAFPQSQVRQSTYPAAQRLADTIRAYNRCAKLVYFMTWGRENGHSGFCGSYPAFCTFNSMTDALRRSYVSMANDNDGLVMAAGRAWQQARLADATWKLYNSDGSHPSNDGTYLNACVLFATIFKKSPLGLFDDVQGVDTVKLHTLERAATRAVLDSADTWRLNIKEREPKASFSHTQEMLRVYFKGQCTDCDSVLWDFGDGEQSTELEPTHDYAIPGQYQVTLTALTPCVSGDARGSVTVDGIPVSIATHQAPESLKVYPNPAIHSLHLSGASLSKAWKISIHNSLGQPVYSLLHNGKNQATVPVADLLPGSYWLSLTSAKGEVISRKALLIK